MYCLLKDYLKSKANDNSHNNEEVCEHSKAGYDLFWTYIVDVDWDDSHIVTNENSLKDSADKEDVDVRHLKNSFNNQSKEIDEEDKLPILHEEYFLVKSFMIEEEMRAPMIAPAGTAPWSNPYVTWLLISAP